jgi:hypothetical protein
MLRRLVALVPVVLTAACAGSAPPAAEAAPPPSGTPAAAAAPSAAPAAPEDKPYGSIPTACESSEKGCLPPAAFVKRLCAGFYPDVALHMHGKGTPWQRGYLRVKTVDAWNASGGVSSGDKLVFEEEFLILAKRAPASGGIQVSGQGANYDVLRWDGTCATLMEDEVWLKANSNPKFPAISWKNLDDKVQEALLADEKIAKTNADRRRECKGSTTGDVSDKCQKAVEKLNKLVVDFVRNGGKLPVPGKLP